MRGPKDYLKNGDYNAICDSCGFKFKASELRKRWDGFMVDDACWEPRHPQDFLKAVKESSQNLPWSRPVNDGPNVGPNYTDLYIADGYFTEGINPTDTYFVETSV